MNSYTNIYRMLNNQCFLKEHRIIYHYTSLEVLHKILSTGSFHFNHCSYMNDYSEFECGINKFQKFMKEHVSTDIENEILESFNLIKESRDESKVFIGSFTTLRDSLSQWRAYSPSTSNISIGLNINNVSSYCHNNDIPFGSIKYTNDFNAVLKGYFDELMPSLEYVMNNQTPENVRGMNTIIFGYLFMLAPFVKHEGFKEEEKVRIIAGNRHETKYKYQNGVYLPYIEFNFGGNLAEMISEIWVGPSASQELTKRSLKLMLKNYNIIDQDKIKVSPIPYRLMSE